jgi:hypothetical protein
MSAEYPVSPVETRGCRGAKSWGQRNAGGLAGTLGMARAGRTVMSNTVTATVDHAAERWQFDAELMFALHLLANGQRIATQWYEPHGPLTPDAPNGRNA